MKKPKFKVDQPVRIARGYDKGCINCVAEVFVSVAYRLVGDPIERIYQEDELRSLPKPRPARKRKGAR
jgi:hypothetical protein